MTDLTTQPLGPELIPLGPGWRASWLVSQQAAADPTGEDYHAGWLIVNACAIDRTVDIGSDEVFTPAEARNLAHALLYAAQHAESYAHTAAGVLRDEQSLGYADYQDMPMEHRRAINEWIGRRVAKAWKRGDAADGRGAA